MTTSSLSSAETLSLLQAWAAQQAALKEQTDLLERLTGAGPDSPLLTPVFEIWDAYTRLVAEKVGDTQNWLEYFEFDCEMGARPKEVSWPAPDGTGRIVVCLDSLAALLKVLQGV